MGTLFQHTFMLATALSTMKKLLTHTREDVCAFLVALIVLLSLPQPQTGAMQARLSQLTLQQ